MKTKKATKKDKRVRMFEGLPVVDAAQDVTITVTKKDVQNSKRKNPGECAAALAGSRRFHMPVKVFLSRMYVKDKNQWVRFITPGNVAREIVSFDRSSAFEPGEYEFKAPSKQQRLGTYTHKRERHSGTKKRKNHITTNVRVSAKESYQNAKS